MTYVDSAAFCTIIAPVDAELAGLRAKHEQLARTIEEKKAANEKETRKSFKRPTVQNEKSLLTVETRILELEKMREQMLTDPSCSMFSYEHLTNMWVDVSSRPWSDEEKKMGEASREAYEGKYERSFCHRNGWSFVPSQETHDFPDLGEGKYIGRGNGTFSLHAVGREAWGEIMFFIARTYDDQFLQECRDAIKKGEVSTGMIYRTMPLEIRNLILDQLKPEKLLSVYNTMYIFTDYGPISVPKDEFAAAFRLSSVTRASVHYQLSRSYIEGKLRSTLVTKEPAAQLAA